MICLVTSSYIRRFSTSGLRPLQAGGHQTPNSSSSKSTVSGHCHTVWNPKLSYDRRPVFQSVLKSGHHLGYTTNFSLFSKEIIWTQLRFVIIGRLSWERAGLLLTVTGGPRQYSVCRVLIQPDLYFVVSLLRLFKVGNASGKEQGPIPNQTDIAAVVPCSITSAPTVQWTQLPTITSLLSCSLYIEMAVFLVPQFLLWKPVT
jgi:hypothetical protein